MAARRLLIVMLILLGLSTLAAALVPQDSPREDSTTGSTTTTPPAQTATTPAVPAFVPPTKIFVGGKRLPIVFPVHVGQQLTLLVRSRFATELAIPAFGLIEFASPAAPARFELLADAPGTYGILFSRSRKVAARIKVVGPGWKKRRAKSRARAGSGPA
jgi:hypothetical protein